MKFSKEQHLTIRHDAKHMLVSATAGAGKTTVMTERIYERLREGFVSPSELLVMTFSEKAATQMKERIEKRLNRSIAEAPEAEKPHYQSLLDALPDASISTIHAFCNRLVAEFVSDLVDDDGALFLEPGYRVLDPDQAAGILVEATTKTLEDLYILASMQTRGVLEDSDKPVPSSCPYVTAETELFTLAEPVSRASWLKSFLEMTAAYAPGYSDDRLIEILGGIVTQLRSLPDYENWLRGVFSKRLTTADFNQQAHIKALRQTVEALASGAVRDIVEVLHHPYMDLAREPKAAKTVAAIVEPLERAAAVLPDLLTALDPANDAWWDDVLEIGQRLTELTLPTRRFDAKNGPLQQSFFELVTPHIVPLLHLIGGKFKGATLLREYGQGLEYVFVRTRADQMLDEEKARPLLLRLLETALLVDRRYRALKLRQNSVDFSDFEHYALRLLGRPDVCSALAVRYKEVYLDEYQDTSSIQEAVIEKLALGCTFMVGDVKQSIYRFRHANPGLFLARSGQYRLVRPDEPLTAEKTGDLLLLNTNYRSRAAVLESVNDMFSVLMQDAAGEIVYDTTHWLNPGRTDESEDKAVTFTLVVSNAPENTVDDGEEDVDPDALSAEFSALDFEAFAAVRQIRQLIASGRAPGDIVVLARNHTICAHYFRALKAAGVPVFGADNEALFNTAELSLLERLFELLINGNQDIPLASVMLSALAGTPFDESELLSIRNDAEESLTFHESVYARAELDDRLGQKVKRFLDQIEGWRRLADRLSVHDLLLRIIDESRLRTYVATLPFGPSRVSYLDRFSAWLRAAEPADLRALLSVIGEMKRRKATMHDFGQDAPDRHAVRVMTMHTSKGLEFPVVFVVGLSQRLNRGRSERFAISESHGVTTDFVDEASGRTYKNLRHHYHIEDHLAGQMQEELRLLYVALTRAKDQLFMFGCAQELEKVRIQAEALFTDLDPFTVSFERQQRASTFATLLIGALRQKYRSAVDAWLAGEKEATAGSVHLVQAVGQPIEIATDDLPTSPERVLEQPDPAKVERIAALLDPTVPNEASAVAPSKLTVSELKRQMDSVLLEEAAFDKEIEQPTEQIDMAFLVNRPDALRRDEAKHLGTALHTVFQFLDLKALRQQPTEWTYDRLLDEMVGSRQLSADDRSLVRPFYQEVLAYAESELADRLLADGTRIYREMPFTLAVPTPGLPDEITLVQGIIDLWYQTADGKAGLVDFKSDQLRADTVEALTALYAERYGVQLDYYAAAIEKAIGNDVHWKQIWAIRQGVQLTLD
ncbi:MAG TPA: UvrD-helicase domain-containing protein [Fastidiosipila sp.]|nr:UvrD-helicase domain-containing protein [Fastidiosipila sp.]